MGLFKYLFSKNTGFYLGLSVVFIFLTSSEAQPNQSSVTRHSVVGDHFIQTKSLSSTTSVSLQSTLSNHYLSPVWCDDLTIGIRQGYVGGRGIRFGEGGGVGARPRAKIIFADGTETPEIVINNPNGYTNDPISNQRTMVTFDRGWTQPSGFDPNNELTSPFTQVRPTNLVFPRITEESFDYTQLASAPNATFTGTTAAPGVISGGPRYFKELNLSGTVRFEEGHYFIGALNIDNSTSIRVSGQVFIHIARSFTAGNQLQMNNLATDNPANLRIILWENPDGGNSTTTFTIPNRGGGNTPGTAIKGLVYSHAVNSVAVVNNNNIIEGGFVVAGTLTLGNNASVWVNDRGIGDAFDTPQCIEFLEITHPLETVSCLPANIEVKACANASCNRLYTDPFDLIIESNSLTSFWGGTPGGDNPMTVRMNAGAVGGAVSLKLFNPPGGLAEIEPLYFNRSAGVFLPVESNETLTRKICAPGVGGNNCITNFSESGLVITGDDLGISRIGPHPAGTVFNSYLQAIETDNETGACKALFTGKKEVFIGVKCIDPVKCSGLVPFELTSEYESVSLTPVDQDKNYIHTAINVKFDEDGKAEFENRFRDVGKLRIGVFVMLEGAPPAPGEPVDVRRSLTGGSENFVIFPAALQAFPLNDDGTTHPGGMSPFKAAGTPFDVKVQSFDIDGNVTPNFGRESGTALIELTSERVWPATGVNGEITGLDPANRDLTILGQVTYNDIAWSDVGIVDIRAALAGNIYLDANPIPANQITSTPGEIGRFFPSHFIFDSGTVSNECTDFTYMGSPGIETQFIMRAANINNDVTFNYNADYNDKALVRIVAAHTDPADDADDEFSSRLLYRNSASDWVTPEFEGWQAGTLDVVLNASELKFGRLADSSIDGPYPEVRLGLRIMEELDDRDFDFAALTEEQKLQSLLGESVRIGDEDDLDVLNMRYGRLVLENVFGPENEPLPVLMRAEYWNGQRFAINLSDECTPHNFASLSVVADPDNIGPTESGTAGLLTDGQVVQGQMRWNNPNEVIGVFEFAYDSPEWLRFQWDGSAGGNVNPKATGEFGRFRARDRVIYWLEQR